MKICYASLALAAGFAALPLSAAAAPASAPVVRMVTTRGVILIKLYPKDAPVSCANFEKLVRKGFYNGLTFHRVGNAEDLTAPPGIAQGGDPQGNGMGGPGYTIKGEFKANGVNNSLTHVAGAVAMARTGAPPYAPQAEQVRAFNSAGSQFYICSQPAHFLDGSYAVFGQVIKGLDVAGRLKVGDKMTSVTLGSGAVSAKKSPHAAPMKKMHKPALVR